MLHATLALARRIDLGEIGFCALAAGAGQPGGAASLAVGGGLALCGAAGSPFNKVLALGLGVEASDEDLDAIDAFYDERGEPAQIELCPLATPGVAAKLIARGYVVRAFENQLASPMEAVCARLNERSALVTVVPVRSTEDDDAWLDVVPRGFAAGEGSDLAASDDADVVGKIGAVMKTFRHETMTRYLARVDGVPVGGGAAYLVDGMVGLTGTATVPSHRGGGVQHAVVAEMLRDAAGRADLAMATTEPGSRSQRTFERFGFQVIYTRTIFIRAFDASRD